MSPPPLSILKKTTISSGYRQLSSSSLTSSSRRRSDPQGADPDQEELVETPASQDQLNSRPVSLCWGNVTIYEFPMILGDHPSVSEGPPVTIDWQCIFEETVDLAYYEYNMRRCVQDTIGEYSPQRRTRSRKEMHLDQGKRSSFLLNSGCTMQQIVTVLGEIEAIKQSRRSNMKGRYASFKAVFQKFNNRKQRSGGKRDEGNTVRILASQSA